jgi:hypothetical protein
MQEPLLFQNLPAGMRHAPSLSALSALASSACASSRFFVVMHGAGEGTRVTTAAEPAIDFRLWSVQ